VYEDLAGISLPGKPLCFVPVREVDQAFVPGRTGDLNNFADMVTARRHLVVRYPGRLVNTKSVPQEVHLGKSKQWLAHAGCEELGAAMGRGLHGFEPIMGYCMGAAVGVAAACFLSCMLLVLTLS
jgi:hypothetical protein